ncbi:MAG: ATP-binding protein [Thermoplasmataceae archaeon]
MSQQRFVDREEELQILEEAYSADGDGTLFIIYGRRRVGKTELISRFTGNRGIYFLATNEGDRENIRSFQHVLSRFLDDPAIEAGQFQDWHSLFSMVTSNNSFLKKSKESRIIIAFDEFPYLIEANRSIPSVFQKIYDTLLKTLNVMVILSGSSISIMENNVLSYKSPLYGRRTGQLQLNPLKFKYLREFVNYEFEDLCKIYFVFGGIPEYLLKIDSNLTFWENISRKILSRGAPLYEEAEFLLRTELREPRNYMLILRSIAFGNHTLGEICTHTGLDKSMVSKYMDILMNLDLVTAETPFGAPSNFKRRLYWISDHYLKFWFRYVLPNRSEIESSYSNEVVQKVSDDFGSFAGEQFEHLVRELVIGGIMGRSFTNASRWWGRKSGKRTGEDIAEIDIVAYSEARNELLFGECKWTNKPVSVNIVDSLKAKSVEVLRQYPDSTVTYAVFSRSGFTGNMSSVPKDTVLMDLMSIKKALSK